MPNGPEPDNLEKLQREYTAIYKERVEKFRTARILWAVLTRDSHILITNPYWMAALGHSEVYLRYRSLWTITAENERDRWLAVFSQMQFGRVDYVTLTLGHAKGFGVPVLAWFGQWVEKSSPTSGDIWVATLTAAICDE